MNEARAQPRTSASVSADTQQVKDAAIQPDSPRLAVSADVRVQATRVRPRALLSEQARTRLAHLLIGKSIVESLFIAALVVIFIQHTFKPSFRGSLDHADGHMVAGWVIDVSAPATRVEVQLYIDGHFAVRGQANQQRADVRAAGRALDEFHGYSLLPPPLPPGEHEARVYAAQTARGGRIMLQQVDKSLRFVVPVSDESKAITDAWWEAARP